MAKSFTLFNNNLFCDVIKQRGLHPKYLFRYSLYR